jgi:hypothetical protein
MIYNEIVALLIYIILKEHLPMSRINLKKVLKTAAVTLIALPEPFTTPLGIVMLCLVLAVYHKRSLDQFGDLEVLIKRSLQNTEPLGFQRHLSKEHLATQHHTKQPALIPQNNSWFDNRRICASTLHHTLKTSFPQYEAEQGLYYQDNSRATGLNKAKPANEFHKLKTCL